MLAWPGQRFSRNPVSVSSHSPVTTTPSNQSALADHYGRLGNMGGISGHKAPLTSVEEPVRVHQGHHELSVVKTTSAASGQASANSHVKPGTIYKLIGIPYASHFDQQISLGTGPQHSHGATALFPPPSPPLSRLRYIRIGFWTGKQTRICLGRDRDPPF